ncbi:MAG: DUF3881 family protein [Lachnospiraceae bacterium]|nr:DUF3881 family protein [Lachnospiraceae bacterium]
MKSLHKYLRAIGFSKFANRKELKKLLTSVVVDSTSRVYTTGQDEIMLGEFCKDFAENIGIAVCGEFDEENEDKFVYDYYYPYLRGTGITTTEDVSVERHAAKESYAGVCDDLKVGVSLIFYLQNMIPYIKAQVQGRLPIKGTTLTLSALSLQGTVMMPIMKDEFQKKKIQKESTNRTNLIAAARRGDEDAIETLTLEDMDMYTTISRKIQKEDVFSLVDTYCMPYGVECDQYSVLGEILECRKVKNTITGEEVYQMSLYCNELTFDVCINAEDLFGEPQAGRRFKGIIWLQGFINFPE